MMSLGIGLFGVMTSYLATLFMRLASNMQQESDDEEDAPAPYTMQGLDALQMELTALRLRLPAANVAQGVQSGAAPGGPIEPVSEGIQ